MGLVICTKCYSVNLGEQIKLYQELSIKNNSKINQGLIHAVRFAAALTLRPSWSTQHAPIQVLSLSPVVYSLTEATTNAIGATHHVQTHIQSNMNTCFLWVLTSKHEH